MNLAWPMTVPVLSDGIVTLQERRQLRNELTSLRNEVERMMRNERRRRG